MTRKRKARSTAELNSIIDGTWSNFNTLFRHVDFTEKELKYMLNREMNDRRRRQIAMALHSRYSTVRSMNERIKIYSECGGVGLPI